MAFVTGTSSSIFVHGDDPTCTCGHTNRSHRWTRPHVCVDCACKDYDLDASPRRRPVDAKGK